MDATVDEAGAAELSAVPGTGPFGPEERPMRDYPSLPHDMADADLAACVARARDHVATYPPKQK